jgi:hypothetical protein
LLPESKSLFHQTWQKERERLNEERGREQKVSFFPVFFGSLLIFSAGIFFFFFFQEGVFLSRKERGRDFRPEREK